MRWLVLAGLAVLAGCGPDAQTVALDRQTSAEANARAVQRIEELGRTEVPPTPEQIAERQRAEAKAAQEDELLERALTNAPDYMAAVRRAAIANVDAADPLPTGRRSRAETASAREQRIAAEEGRLADLVEKRRRERLSIQARNEQAARDQAALATCQARGAQMDAAYYSRRDLLNLQGLAAGNQARNACWNAYQRTGILP